MKWLGDIPAHWDCIRLKFVADLVGRKVESQTTEKYVGLENVQSNNGKFIAKEDVTPEGLSSSFSCGDVLFGKLRPYLAKSWLADISGICSSEFLVLKSKKVDARFLNYFTLTEEFITQVDSSTYGSKMPRASWDFIGLLRVPVPQTESKKIAAFLDHETAKIDALIEKQQRLIELLKEKRQAVISHAVTKGLNPNAPMKDSGVEWLGDVPAHWVVAKLSFRYEVLLGKMLDDKKITGNFLGSYLRNTDVQWDQINTEDLPQMDFYPNEQDRYSVKKLDLIVCEGGEIGRCAIWGNDDPCFYQKALHRLRPLNTNCDMTRFMFYHLFNAVHQERFISGAGKSTIAHLPAESFRQFRFAYPPLTEQVEISNFLDEQKLKFDALEIKALSQISLLKERRTALISAAVTGKIDVCDWQAAASLI
ncbi:restriction endonuclease subunit S [Delftia sp. RIT313]|uniref:restriction endonuclease subunit S n=1 Tax=Delftia sp. RIT313 TaxID=1468410 RepID=UPI00045387AC|nr:restriction endonuclease subunit S [Delftia sp. RIT313]EZP52860.1 Restriction modification system DNA specificity domain protein [Delftia sp. RIT313]